VRVPVTIPGAGVDAGTTDAGTTDAGTTDAGDAGTTDPCMAFGGCASCTAQAQCGWCNDGQIGCHTGIGTGPNDGSCVQTNWAWVSNQCVAPPVDAGADAPPASDACNAFADCHTCTLQPVCGWCGSSCWTGTGTGPNGGACVQSQWTWISTSCH